MCHCSTNATDFSLSHTNSSPFVHVVSKTSLFQRHTGGAGAKHSPATAETLVQSPVVTPTGWLGDKQDRIGGIKGACYTLLVKVAGEKDTVGDRRRRTNACFHLPSTTVGQETARTALQRNYAF